jgi:hypothetical protein
MESGLSNFSAFSKTRRDGERLNICHLAPDLLSCKSRILVGVPSTSAIILGILRKRLVDGSARYLRRLEGVAIRVTQGAIDESLPKNSKNNCGSGRLLQMQLLRIVKRCWLQGCSRYRDLPRFRLLPCCGPVGDLFLGIEAFEFLCQWHPL